MNRYLIIVAVALVSACVTFTEPSSRSAEQELCTQEDQETGSCPQWTALAAHLDTRDYAQSQGYDVSYETTSNCSTDRCQVRIELPGLKIVATCEYAGANGVRLRCSSRVCGSGNSDGGSPCNGPL